MATSFTTQTPEIAPALQPGVAGGPFLTNNRNLGSIGSSINRFSRDLSQRERDKARKEKEIAERGAVAESALAFSSIKGVQVLPETLERLRASPIGADASLDDVELLNEAEITARKLRSLKRQSKNRSGELQALVELAQFIKKDGLHAPEFIDTFKEFTGRSPGLVLEELFEEQEADDATIAKERREGVQVLANEFHIVRGDLTDTELESKVILAAADMRAYTEFTQDADEKKKRNELKKIDARNDLIANQAGLIHGFNAVSADLFKGQGFDMANANPAQRDEMLNLFRQEVQGGLAEQATTIGMTSSEMLEAVPALAQLIDLTERRIKGEEQDEILDRAIGRIAKAIELDIMSDPRIARALVILEKIVPVISLPTIDSSTKAGLLNTVRPLAVMVLNSLTNEGPIPDLSQSPPKETTSSIQDVVNIYKAVSSGAKAVDTAVEQGVGLSSLRRSIEGPGTFLGAVRDVVGLDPIPSQEDIAVNTLDTLFTIASEQELPIPALDFMLELTADPQRNKEFNMRLNTIPQQLQDKMLGTYDAYIQDVRASVVDDLSSDLFVENISVLAFATEQETPVGSFFGLNFSSGPPSIPEQSLASLRGKLLKVREAIVPVLSSDGFLSFHARPGFESNTNVTAKVAELDRRYGNRFRTLVRSQAHFNGNQDYQAAGNQIIGGAGFIANIDTDDPFVQLGMGTTEEVTTFAQDLLDNSPVLNDLYNGSVEDFVADMLANMQGTRKPKRQEVLDVEIVQ